MQVNGTVTYTYDGEGRRVRKVDAAGVTTVYAYNAFGELASEHTSAGPSGTAATYYLTTDHLGSTRLITDAGANVISRHDYLPFGEELWAGIGGRTTAQFFVLNPTLTQRFTGKERDTETGLDFSIARYYSAAMGRFNSADLPFIDQDLSNPQSWNLYSYVRNSPLTLVDPDGRCSVKEPGGPATDDPGKPCTAGRNQSIDVEDLIVAVKAVAIVGNELMRRQGESLAETLLDGLQWLARPRDLGCLTKNTAAGAGGGLVAGAAWGLAGGPGGVATVPGGAVLGFGGGGLAGWSGGMVSCQVGTPNKGGGGESGKSSKNDKSPSSAESPAVSELLKAKKGSIKQAPLEAGSPTWEEVSKMKWSEIEAGAKAGKPGFKTIKKLLTDRRFDK